MLDAELINNITLSFENGKSIRRNLPLSGKLVIDQKLPYLCVYRFSKTPDKYISALLKTQGAYLIVNCDLDINLLLTKLVGAAIKEFKSYLVVEMWPNLDAEENKIIRIWHPGARISSTIEALEKGFREFDMLVPGIEVSLVESSQRHPYSLEPLIPLNVLKKTGTLLIGIAIPPLFHDAETLQEYPMFFRRMSRQFAKVVKLAAYEFVRVQSDNKFEHYLMLGKTRLDNLVRSADRRISEVSEKMDFILRVTPVNTSEEWANFKQNKFSKLPSFTYRLISIDPEIEKRKLFSIPLENIEHPTLAFLLRDKRMELEKQLIMLEERGTSEFLRTSQSVFGELGQEIMEIADSLLQDQAPNEQPEYEMVNAVDFARAAEAELNEYRSHFSGLVLNVKIQENVSGIMVSGPDLLIGKDLKISRDRVNALIQHEVGTHILTYCNGHRQPLHLMYAGFAGYEQLQEGMAVLSEYLVGGMDVNRLKLLAARVIAVDTLVKGADFIETFNVLLKDYGFQGRTAFNISMRVHRGGGYTKDAIYLKGLVELLAFIKAGGHPSQLYGGKFALKHLPLIEELTYLRILQKPQLPAFFHTAGAIEKLEKIKNGILLKDLIH